MEDGKGDSCPAGILRVTFYKQVFLFNHSQILVHFFTQDSISYMTKNVFLVNFTVLLMIVLVNFTVPSDCSTSSAGWRSSWWTEVFSCWTFACDFSYKFICKLQRPIMGNITFALRSFLVFHLFMRNFGFNGYFPFLLGLTFWSLTKNHLINWQTTR